MMVAQAEFADWDRIDGAIATAEFYVIVALITLLWVIMLARPKRTWVQWGMTAKETAFVYIVWSVLYIRLHGLETLPQPARLIGNTVCVVLLLFALVTAVAYWIVPLFRGRSDDDGGGGKGD